jgi:hypothetical protein
MRMIVVVLASVTLLVAVFLLESMCMSVLTVT